MPPHLTTAEPPTVKLFTYMAVREDGIELFGFGTEDELSSFKMLITVSGVGPKAAIAILSHMTPQKLALAIVQDDKKAIAKANGIGPKTAARIVLELKDKLKKESISTLGDVAETDEPLMAVLQEDSKLSDAQKALMVLGYSKNEAVSALAKVDQSLDLDDMIRLALKQLMK